MIRSPARIDAREKRRRSRRARNYTKWCGNIAVRGTARAEKCGAARRRIARHSEKTNDCAKANS
ncbi:MAG: hypothetical protein LBM59_00570 [Ruminococcus sp.]|nr:hypothetical protein [Ruminococcus sp.]